MSLHVATKPDWEGVDDSRRNRWQKLAAASGGMLTPANAVSVLGAGLVIWGLFLLLSSDTVWLGIILIIIGRLADVADGFVADLTATKSPFGEAVDATIDKIVLGLALLFFLFGNIIPITVTWIFLVHTIYNTAVGFLGYFKQLDVHPSKYGKYATAAAWTSISLFVATTPLPNGEILDNIISLLAWLTLAVFIASAIPSSVGYTLNYVKKKK